ncbi:MAG: hypothetical protein ACLQCB_15645 [Spirochaetia bacterium]
MSTDHPSTLASLRGSQVAQWQLQMVVAGLMAGYSKEHRSGWRITGTASASD